MRDNRITKNQVKLIHSLKQKKFRQKYNKYTLEGEKLVLDLIRLNPSAIEMLVFTEPFAEKHADLLSSVDINTCLASTNDMKRMSQFKHASNILALSSLSSFPRLLKIPASGRFIYLEQIQDPGNLGTIIRTADWFGYDGVLLSEGSVDLYNSKVIQSSMGSVFRMPTMSVNLDELSTCDLPCIATSLQGSDLSTYSFPGSFVLAFGNEGQGLSEAVLDLCSKHLLISDQFTKGAESLNISMSAAVCMFAESAQRL